ncbi:MAG: alpha-hydroxy-acid oxidizing protein [Sandaracinaceae bacterium]|nr:alpha-hydroxy-acid oxidizing protein [Sandaracinaceae bacterium]
MTKKKTKSVPINLLELEAAARARLDDNAFDYYASGAHDELTLRENRAAFERIALRYRVLVDVSRRDPSTEVLGAKVSMPVLIAPTAFHRMAHPDGERATARAAAHAGTLMINSTLSNTPMEEVVLAAGAAPVWFQLYVYKDRGETKALVERAEAAGARALVLTVDAPLLGTRERDRRNRFRLPAGLTVANMTAVGKGELPDVADSGLAAYFATMLDPSITFDDLSWLKSVTTLPLVVKGVVRADDAARCVAAGADAVVVSNHGGRQLDTSVATIRALPEVVDAIGGRAEVYVDGGVRRGTDVLKALAYGARAVLLGRPVLYGLALDGQRGVERALSILREELDLAMALAGCPDVAAITRDLLADGPSEPASGQRR